MTDLDIADHLNRLGEQKDRLLADLFRIEGQIIAFKQMEDMLKSQKPVEGKLD